MQTFIADHVSFVENALHQREEALERIQQSSDSILCAEGNGG